MSTEAHVGAVHPVPTAESAQPGSRANGDDSEGRVGTLRKAAVLVLALDETVASELLQSLDDRELERLTAEIARMGVVDQATVATVLEEFHDLAQLHGMLREGGPDQAIRLVEKSFPPERSRRLVELLEAHRPHLPFAFLSGAETESLLAMLEGEQPQMVAVVLAHMPPSKAAELLETVPLERRKDLMQRIAGLSKTPAEVIEQLGDRLRKYLDTVTLAPSRADRGGPQALADILRAGGNSGTEMLVALEEEHPELAEEIRKRLFVFEDIVRLDDRSLQRLLQEVDRLRLVLVLKTASPALKEKIFRNLSKRAGEVVREEMDYLGPVRLAEVQAAREAFVDAVLQLEEAGAIYIEGRGRREDRLVY